MQNTDDKSAFHYAEWPVGGPGVFATETEQRECRNVSEAAILAASRGGYVRNARGCRLSDEEMQAAKLRALVRLADEEAVLAVVAERILARHPADFWPRTPEQPSGVKRFLKELKDFI